MSYTFSRRDFMKYTAVAAVAVAGSSMFTGCSLISNPNRPVGTIGQTLKPGSKICEATLLGDTDKPTYDAGTDTFVCTVGIRTLVDTLQINRDHFQLNITDADGNVKRYFSGTTGVTVTVDGGSTAAVKQYETLTTKVTFTGVPDVENAASISVIYLPRMEANGKPSDSYSDVYATWTFKYEAISQ